MILAIILPLINSFYVPGVTPSDFKKNDQVPLHVNVLSSLKKSLIPYDYYYDSFHFCRPEEGPKSQSENLGSILFGDRLFSSSFQLNMLKNTSCNLLCEMEIPGYDAKFINERISEQYLFNWMVDGLPVAQKGDTGMEHATSGFNLGQRIKKSDEDTPRLLLNNHYEIYVLYHTEDDIKHRVVGVFVNPSSTISKTCDHKDIHSGVVLDESKTNKVPVTYDVIWMVGS